MRENRFTPKQVATLYVRIPGTEIKRKTGLGFHKIYPMLREAGVEVRPRGRRPVLQSPGKEALLSMRAEGLSQQKIAQNLGVSKRTVQRWLDK